MTYTTTLESAPLYAFCLPNRHVSCKKAEFLFFIIICMAEHTGTHVRFRMEDSQTVLGRPALLGNVWHSLSSIPSGLRVSSFFISSFLANLLFSRIWGPLELNTYTGIQNIAPSPNNTKHEFQILNVLYMGPV